MCQHVYTSCRLHASVASLRTVSRPSRFCMRFFFPDTDASARRIGTSLVERGHNHIHFRTFRRPSSFIRSAGSSNFIFVAPSLARLRVVLLDESLFSSRVVLHRDSISFCNHEDRHARTLPGISKCWSRCQTISQVAGFLNCDCLRIAIYSA